MKFYVQQLRASYILSDIKKVIDKLSDKEQKSIYNMFSYDSAFEMVTNFKVGNRANNNLGRILCLVARNIIQRGFPAIAPDIIDVPIENTLISSELIKQALVIFDSDYNFDNKKRYYQKTIDGLLEPAEINKTESLFLKNLDSNIAQYLELQKPVETIINYPNTSAEKYSNYTSFCLDEDKSTLLKKFKDQRLDFALVLPEIEENTYNCIAIELDGPQHQEIGQQTKDGLRDDLLKELYWDRTLRITDIHNKEQYENKLNGFSKQYFSLIGEENAASKYITIPLYAARMAESFLYLVEHNDISLFEKDKIYIYIESTTHYESVIYGIQNALDILYHLANLTSKSPNVGDIYLKINNLKNGKICNFLLQPNSIEREIVREIPKQKISLHIYEHMNQRLFAFQPEAALQKTVWLYSSYSEDNKASLRTYNHAITYDISEKNQDSLNYFLLNIFKKNDFRPKQIDIIKAALNRRNVIGLLPTGSGKTLTYQLSAMLQPQVTIVIAPLVSLMNDQVINLKKVRIDSCATVNGSVMGAPRRLILKNIKENCYQFVYIAPERLQIKEFKALVRTLPVAHIVLDEAHCVSQWGHDFRSSYLRVGETIERDFKNTVTMALTGTASCNVITDIKRELNMKKDVEIVTPNNFRRSELHFKILNLDKDIPLKQRIHEGIVENAIKSTIEYYYKKSGGGVNYEDNRMEQFFSKKDKEYINTGLVFCPYAEKTGESVETIHEHIKNTDKNETITIDRYHSKLENDEKNNAQKQFTDGKTALLIATKAFGMGIDKPNIRFTIHTCIPESIEAFYQEAGRAGRDRNDAVNVIIAPPVNTNYTNTADKAIYKYFFDQSFPNKDMFKAKCVEFLHMEYIIKNSFQDNILAYFEDKDISKDIEFKYIKNGNSVVLSMLAGKGHLVHYDVRMDSERNIEITPKNKRIGILKNTVYCIYETIIKKAISKEFGKNGSSESEQFQNFFNIPKLDIEKNLINALKEQNKDKCSECYIGLEKGSLINPIDRLLRGLIKEKKEKTGDPLQLNLELQRAINSNKKEYLNSKKKYDINSFREIYNEICCLNDLPECNDVQEFQKIVNASNSMDGTIDQLEEKILYYLGVLGIYEDYERHYSPSYVKIRLVPFSKDLLKKNIRKYIGGYETRDYLRRKIGNLEILDKFPDDDVENLLITALNYIIDYSYDKIKNYRFKQTEIMYRCIQSNDIKNDNLFMEEIYKYFESKYADELLKDVDKENLALVDKWIEKVKKDSEQSDENILENLSHLRTSALKVQEARPQAYTPYFLHAYATMEDSDLDIRSGIESYLRGVKIIGKMRDNYRTKLKSWCNEIFSTEDKVYLQEVDKILKMDYNRVPELAEMKEVLLLRLMN